MDLFICKLICYFRFVFALGGTTELFDLLDRSHATSPASASHTSRQIQQPQAADMMSHHSSLHSYSHLQSEHYRHDTLEATNDVCDDVLFSLATSPAQIADERIQLDPLAGASASTSIAALTPAGGDIADIFSLTQS